MFSSWENIQDNTAPVVKILTPTASTALQFNTPIRYSITVSDKEDGESKFDEIPANEVMLKVKLVADSSAAKAYLTNADPHQSGFLEMRMSNCFNCHAFKTTLIGPSLQDISKKYPHNPDNAARLAAHVKDGSVNVWGTIPMPAHPELNAQQVQEMINWIYANTEEADVNYYMGTGGTFTLTPPAAGAVVLEASYLDHGLKETPGKNLEGKVQLIRKVQ